jgi:flagellar basal-body rod protein FlgB
MLFDSMYRSLEGVLDLRSQQHTLTAANLANADTPGYRAKVIDFASELEERFGAGEALAMRVSEPGHLGGPGGPDAVEVLDLDPPDGSLDGNSVLVERETVRLQENSLMYRAVSSGLSRRLAMLRYAANDGR